MATSRRARTTSRTLRKTVRRPLASVGLSSIDEDGSWFETGTPVTFPFARNPAPSPKGGREFAQHLEPSGRYLIHSEHPPRGWQSGTVTFRKPLVLMREFDDDYAGAGGWKARLSKFYGGKKKAALSRALRADGYDGIVTVHEYNDRGRDAYETSEIVDLTGQSGARKPVRRRVKTTAKRRVSRRNR